MNYLSLLFTTLCYSFGVLFGFLTLIRTTPLITDAKSSDILFSTFVTALLIAGGIYTTTHPAFN